MAGLSEILVPDAFRSDDHSERRNARIHLASLISTKFADGVIDPKLVLAWLFTALGAPAYLIGALVPIREAGALLPQLLLAPKVAAARTKKQFWAFGSAVQGAAALGIGIAALTLSGAAFGWVALALLAILAVARSVCSISYKDALARTVAKTKRGGVNGSAGSIASTLVVLFGAALATGVLALDPPTIALAICGAGALWLLGAAMFLRLDEPEDEPGNAPRMHDLFAPLRDDPQLRIFIASRALLTVTALAPPFIVALSAAESAKGLGELGPLVLASAFASILSASIWGRLSDMSTRKTLLASAALGAMILGTCAVIGYASGGLGGLWGAVTAIFAAQIAYEGVRSGRKIHLTDMAGDDTRARYTALSNTIIGAVLVAGGAFGIVAELLSIPAVLALFALFCVLALPCIWHLDEVQSA